jgi:hypothetical protein
MKYARTSQSLRTRIDEAQRGAEYSIDQSYFVPRGQGVTFAERYRGTQYETPTPVLVKREPVLSRGRSFLLVVGTASLSITGLLLVASPA